MPCHGSRGLQRYRRYCGAVGHVCAALRVQDRTNTTRNIPPFPPRCCCRPCGTCSPLRSSACASAATTSARQARGRAGGGFMGSGAVGPCGGLGAAAIRCTAAASAPSNATERSGRQRGDEGRWIAGGQLETVRFQSAWPPTCTPPSPPRHARTHARSLVRLRTSARTHARRPQPPPEPVSRRVQIAEILDDITPAQLAKLQVRRAGCQGAHGGARGAGGGGQLSG